jgi:hypothetical protein
MPAQYSCGKSAIREPGMKRAERSEGFLATFYHKLRNDSVFSGRYYAAHSHPDDRFRPVTGRRYGRAAMTKNWLEALQDAIHETDPDHAELKIRIAEMAISSRFHELEASPDALEKQALLDALGSIRLLRSTRRTHK